MSDLPNTSEGWLSPTGVDLVWFTGPDAIRFLNDLISQEIAKQGVGEVRRSLLLGPQGKLDHILWVLRGEDQVGLVTSPGRGAELATTLTRYRIRIKCEIEVESRPRWVVFDGPEVSGWTGVRDSAVVADISWRNQRRTLFVGDRPDLEDGSPGRYHTARILAGEPEWGVDVDEGTIPEEAGLVQASVDFTKGCYLGQELVARIDSRGRVVKRLRIVEFGDASASSPATAGVEASVDGSAVGVLTSRVGSWGLATLRFEVEPGAEVEFGSEAATVHPLP